MDGDRRSARRRLLAHLAVVMGLLSLFAVLVAATPPDAGANIGAGIVGLPLLALGYAVVSAYRHRPLSLRPVVGRRPLRALVRTSASQRGAPRRCNRGVEPLPPYVASRPTQGCGAPVFRQFLRMSTATPFRVTGGPWRETDTATLELPVTGVPTLLRAPWTTALGPKVRINLLITNPLCVKGPRSWCLSLGAARWSRAGVPAGAWAA